MLRVLGSLIGVALLALVVWLGFQSADDSRYVVWFGLASAILAPSGIACIGFAIRGKQQQILQELSSVPEIQELISKANTEQERLQLLEDERARLVDIVRLEARRQTLEQRRELLANDASRVLTQMEAIDAEAESLGVEMESSAVLPEVHELAERLDARNEGKTILRWGDDYVAVDPDVFRSMPFGMGYAFETVVRLVARLQNRRGQAP
jgi:hypothetical protein